MCEGVALLGVQALATRAAVLACKLSLGMQQLLSRYGHVHVWL